jgi:hypothetical protein
VTEPVTVLQHVEAALRRACAFDRNDRLPPAALLWPDKASEWWPVVARLAGSVSIVSLGEYDGERSGPAIWIRCIVDRTIGEVPEGHIPIVYLPGIDRHDLRTVEECPADVQPIAELQYRGTFFGSRAGRDWTVTAFFANRDEGLAVEIGRDADTEDAFARALPLLLDEPVASLRQRAPLRAADLGSLLEPDPVRRILSWLSEPASLDGVDAAIREEFARVARAEFDFSPGEDGPIVAAEKLGARAGAWKNAWERFAENPRRYPGVVERLRQARPQDVLVVDHPGSWPQDNEESETALQTSLEGLQDRPADGVRSEIKRLEGVHGERRGRVWAELGQAPLAGALQHLAALASESERQLGGDTPGEIAEAFASIGWRADDAALLAMASVDATRDRRAVEGVVAALYRPWADSCARRFQAAVSSHGAAGFGASSATPSDGECVLFTDGLRFDLGARLQILLQDRDLEVELAWQLAALPSLTGTAKPAVSPAAPRLRGGEGFGTVVAETGQAVTADVLRKTITAEGITVVTNGVIADESASGWAEFGNIDAIGHGQTDRFAQDVGGHVRDIADRVLALLEAGWTTVRVVTDHGWLYVPGGLEKANLPEHLTVTRKGRAARLRDDAGPVEHPVVPWRWDPDVRVAVSPGISCYVANRVYEHGGLSPQECVVPVLTVRSPRQAAGPISIEEATWIGLRLRIRAEGAGGGFSADLRTKAGDEETSVVLSGGQVDPNGLATLLANDERAGEAAVIVVLDQDGELVGQRHTTVGGE